MSAIGRPFPWWIPAGAILIALLYVPTLKTNFDFTDDGNLVYPTKSASLAERAGVVWGKIKANYEHLGPFRPVLWVHWEIEADLFDGNPFVWRSARLCWCGFAAGMLLWFFHEMRISPWAALMAGALAMWSPFRNEIWTSLTLAEGVAMPYAILGLIAAVRAARAEHRQQRILCDIAAVGGVLMALGCKNIFVALIPAQIALRLCPDGWNLREGWRTHNWHILPLLLPIIPFSIHFVYFKWNWHPGQYQPPGPSWTQFVRYLNGLKGAISLDFVGIGIAICVIALLIRRAVAEVWRTHSSAIAAGVLLLIGGIAIYLPMDGVSGRYTMPAAWGLDILIGVVLTSVLAIPTVAWKRAAVGAFAMGLFAVAVSNIGRQEKFAARSEMLWQALEWTERQSLPAGASIAWVSDSANNTGGRAAYNAPIAGLNLEEGVHFDWHMNERHRAKRSVRLFDETGQPLVRVETLTDDGEPPAILVTAFAAPPAALGLGWEKKQTFEGFYWHGSKRYSCSVWVRRVELVSRSYTASSETPRTESK